MGGNYYDAGMSIAVIADAGKPVVTRIAFNANQLVLMSGSNGNYYSPWAVVNGDVFINSAFIQNASIDFAKISDTIQSTNFVSGQTGWRLPKNGNAEFNNATVRGTVYATDGDFAGTVYAGKIVGDLADFSVGRSENKQASVGNNGSLSGTLFNIQQDKGFARKVSVSGTFTGIISSGSVGTGSYVAIRAGDTDIIKVFQDIWTSNGFTFYLPAGTGNVPITYQLLNGHNGAADLKFTAQYDVFVSRNASVIS